MKRGVRFVVRFWDAVRAASVGSSLHLWLFPRNSA
jgi:hypothetical protein